MLIELCVLLIGDEVFGVDVFFEVFVVLLFWIVVNVGLDGLVVVNKVSELFVGYGLNVNILSYGDLVVDGVIDLVKVIRLVVLNVLLVVWMVFIIEMVVVDKLVKVEDYDYYYGYVY